MTHSLQVLLLLTIIVASAKLAGAAANRLRQPAVFGEILIGLLLGPTLLDVLGWGIFAPAPPAADVAADVSLLGLVRDLADLGVILLMFVAGLETDLDEMRRVGRVAFWAAAGGVILPMIGGAFTASAFGLPLLWEGIFIGAILTATSVSISAQTLMELRALRSREGTTILGAAVIDDVMGILVLSVVAALARRGGDSGTSNMALTVVRLISFFVLAWYAGRLFGRFCAPHVLFASARASWLSWWSLRFSTPGRPNPSGASPRLPVPTSPACSSPRRRSKRASIPEYIR
jgi:Kef-type K+ transport system membrane component KefB